jgi:hypothetical protein
MDKGHIHPLYITRCSIRSGSVHTIKKNTEALVDASKKSGLKVNVGTTKNVVMSRYQNAGRIHNIKIDNSSFERVEQFKYLLTTLTKQNSVQEEYKSRFKSGNACHHWVQNFCLPVCYPKI